MPVRYESKFPKAYGAYTELEDPAVLIKGSCARSEFETISPAVFGEKPVSKTSFKLSIISPAKEEVQWSARPEDLFLWVPLYEGEGTKAGDLSIYGYHGNIIGATWKKTRILDLDGIDDRILHSGTSGKTFEKLTFLQWIYIKESKGQYLFSYGFPEGAWSLTKGFGIKEYAGRVRAGIYTSKKTLSAHYGPTIFEVATYLKTWLQIGFTWNGQTGLLKVFRNGVPVGQVTDIIGICNPGYDIRAGVSGANGAFAAIMCGIYQIWTEVKRDEEIGEIYEKERGFYGV